MASFFRPLKYALQGHDIYRMLIREATENDDHQPDRSDLDLIVKRSRDFPEAPWVMIEVLRERLEANPKKWRRALKAMTVLEYCIRHGPEDFLEWGYSSIGRLMDLRGLKYTMKDGTEVAAEVRVKAKEMVSWICAQHRAKQRRIQRESLEEELRKEDQRQERLRRAVELRQDGQNGCSDGTEPPSYSKVVALDEELRSEELRQDRLRLAAQLRQRKHSNPADSTSSDQAGKQSTSRET